MPTGIYLRTKEHCKKISESRKGKKNWLFDKKHTEIHKKRISESMKQNENSKGKKNALGYKHTNEERQKISIWHIEHPNRKFSGTSIERKIAEELTKREIKFKQNIGVEKIANVDFLLNNKIIIQCDGCYWHGCKKHHPKMKDRQNRDKKQDKQLKKLGYKIYRFWEHDINKSPERCVKKIV